MTEERERANNARIDARTRCGGCEHLAAALQLALSPPRASRGPVILAACLTGILAALPVAYMALRWISATKVHG